MTQAERAEHFRALHAGPSILVLPNAWDVASARIFEEAGFPAIGTTSAGVAFSLGYPDGQRIQRGEMLGVVDRIVRAVHVPVTADLEAGYGADPESAGELVRDLIASGAAGCNLEDAWEQDSVTFFAPLELQAHRIQAVRTAATAAGVPLVINARTDVYLQPTPDAPAALDEAVRRLNAYLSAGADCAFAPGVHDAETIGRLVAAVHGPLNVLAGPGMPSTLELQQLGVSRLSVGSGPARATMGLLRRIAAELQNQGTYTSMMEGAIPYNEANALFARRGPSDDTDSFPSRQHLGLLR